MSRSWLGRIIAITLLASGLTFAPSEAAQAGELSSIPGCRVYRPDPHIVTGNKVSVAYFFKCNNRRIRYAKVTIALRRHRALAPDAVEAWYQFDDYRDPTRAGINTSLQTRKACKRGKKYHGDITINVSFNADQMRTHTLRGPSITCP
jgi:hypothetical protein